MAEAEEGEEGVEATNNEPFINVDQLELGVATKGMRAASLDVRNRGREAMRQSGNKGGTALPTIGGGGMPGIGGAVPGSNQGPTIVLPHSEPLTPEQ